MARESEKPAPSAADVPPAAPPRPWQPRFGILGMLLLTLVACTMAAGGSYLVQALRGSRNQQFTFVLFTVTAPLLLLVMVSLAAAVLRRTGGGKKKK